MWIKTTTRLPDWRSERARTVLVTNGASVWTCDLNPVHWYEYRSRREFNITHWMELPDPP